MEMQLRTFLMILPVLCTCTVASWNYEEQWYLDLTNFPHWAFNMWLSFIMDHFNSSDLMHSDWVALWYPLALALPMCQRMLQRRALRTRDHELHLWHCTAVTCVIQWDCTPRSTIKTHASHTWTHKTVSPVGEFPVSDCPSVTHPCQGHQVGQQPRCAWEKRTLERHVHTN